MALGPGCLQCLEQDCMGVVTVRKEMDTWVD